MPSSISLHCEDDEAAAAVAVGHDVGTASDSRREEAAELGGGRPSPRSVRSPLRTSPQSRLPSQDNTGARCCDSPRVIPSRRGCLTGAGSMATLELSLFEEPLVFVRRPR